MSFIAKEIGDSIESEDGHFITSNFQFTFGVPEVALLKLEESKFTSPTFIGEHGDQWRVHIVPYKKDSAIGVLQLVHSESKEETKTTFQICFLDACKKIRWAGSVKTKMFVVGKQQEFLGKTSVTFLTNKTFLVDGLCHFHVQISTQQLKSESENHGFSKGQLKSFLENGDFSDVVLSSGHGEFPASKIILAAQSPVFFAMFKSSMMESEANAVVKIEEFSDETVKGFLEFIYTGETESLEENAEELLEISDKYQVMELKENCESILLKNLKTENALDILILAHLHSPTELKPKIMAFVNKHFKELKNTAPFQRIKKECPQIIFDLYDNSME